MGAATTRNRWEVEGKRERGTVAIKKKETNEEGDRKTERGENAAKL